MHALGNSVKVGCFTKWLLTCCLPCWLFSLLLCTVQASAHNGFEKPMHAEDKKQQIRQNFQDLGTFIGLPGSHAHIVSFAAALDMQL